MSYKTVGSPIIAVVALIVINDEVASQQPPMRQIHSALACATCEVSVDTVATLKLPSDSLSFSIGTTLARLPNRGYMAMGLTETTVPALFDANGRFTKLLGRAGRGPGELYGIERATVTPADTVWVLGEGKKNVYSPQMEFVRQEALRETGDLLVARDGRIVFQARISTPSRAGLPLHILARNGEVVHSFGAIDTDLNPRVLAAANDNVPQNQLRELTPANSNEFWSYNPSRFLLEKYDYTGKLLAQGRHALDGWYAVATNKRPGRGQFRGLALGIVVSSAVPDRLWLVYHERNVKYRTPDSVSLTTANPAAGMHDVIIELLDTSSFQVISSIRLPSSTAIRIKNAPDMLALYDHQDGLFPIYRAVQLRVQR